MKSFFKKCGLLLVCMSILFLSFPTEAYAAGEPSDGLYAFKNLATGEYVGYDHATNKICFSKNFSGNYRWAIRNTTGSSKFYSIQPFDNWPNGPTLYFADKDAEASTMYFIPGYVNNGDSRKETYIRQRFSIRKTASGHNISVIAFENSVDNRLLDVVNGKLCLTRARGSRSQIFTLSRISDL